MEERNSKVILGIDVSKDKLDIWHSVNNTHHIIDNNVRNLHAFLKPLLKQYSDIKVILEPTGGYEILCLNSCFKLNIDVYLVHPNQLVHYAKAYGRTGKSDKLDCQWLVEYMKENHKKVKRLTPEYLENKAYSELLSTRKQLQLMLHSERCRLQQTFLSKHCKQIHQRVIQQLTNELKRCEKAIDDSIAADEERQKKRELLETFKGIGVAVSRTLVIDLPELGQLNKCQVSRLIGVAPINRDSGKNSGHRYIQGGRGTVRTSLYMAAMVAIRYNPEMKVFYDRLKANGKAFKVAIVAVMRKMICILNSMVKHNQPYDGGKELTVQIA